MVGNKIREYRMLRGMTQGELAEKVHVQQNTISSWEIGRTEPNMGMVERLAECLGCRKSDLIGDVVALQALTEEEQKLISLYRLLSKSQRKMIIQVAEAARKEGK